MNKGFIKVIFFTLFFSAISLHAQCLLIDIPVENKIKDASLIIEGKVVDQHAFFNNSNSFIYTAHSIEVNKYFKGQPIADTVLVITEGGKVGTSMINCYPKADIRLNEYGIFMLYVHNISDLPEQYKNTYKLYGGVQGLFKYDITQQTAYTPFHKYSHIKDELYKIIISQTGSAFKDVKPFNIDSLVQSKSSLFRATPSITSFTPMVSTAGTYSVITITGSNFESIRGNGYVEFKNADDGGDSYIQPLSNQYLSWDNNQIEVIIPKSAGTGNIRVTNNSGTSVTSVDTLTISYAQLNVDEDSTASITYLTGRSKQGGITWNLNNKFNTNKAAKEAFFRALESWSCNTFINWKVGATTTVNEVKNDYVNIVSFDDNNTLPQGTLAICYNYWGMCSESVPTWLSVEMDMLISTKINWEYGPDAPTNFEYDFESTILHELGHGHQLAHVIDENDLMNYSIKNGETKRTLRAINITAGSDVISRSTKSYYCSYKPMTALTENNCDNLYEINTDAPFTVYPNPSQGLFSISLPGPNEYLTVECFNYHGELVKELTIDDASYFTSFDFAEFPSGMYILRIDNGEQTAYSKVIIQKVN